jgi:signal transduction histidine kinase
MSSARVVVTDHGVGIPPEDQKRIFRRFETVSSPDSVPGLGLGLYVCGEIVGAHGGTIEVESTPGAGSKFTVEFPRAAADPSR